MIYEMLQKYTCLEDAHLQNAIIKAPLSYKMYYKNKKNGGTRQIFHPAKETKLLQYGLIDMFLSKLPVHEMAMAYIPGKKSPLYQNAQIHAPYSYSLHLDFMNFFPSIVSDDLFRVIKDAGIDLDSKDLCILYEVLFIMHKGTAFLSIGAPASPIISNIVMAKIDKVFCDYANKKYDGVFSRYADDIWFSTNSKNGSNDYHGFIKSEIDKIRSPRLILNEKKTLYCSKKKARVITGLTVTPEGNVVIPREKKRIIRSLLNKRKYQDLGEKVNQKINGYLAFIKDVEPDYYNSLVLKYGEKVVKWKT